MSDENHNTMLRKIELGVLVTIALAVIGFAFWLGGLQNNIEVLNAKVDKVDPDKLSAMFDAKVSAAVIHFGKREVRAFDNSYYADTDGFVTVSARNSGAGGFQIDGLIGTDEIACAGGDNASGINCPGSISFPVVQGESWKVELHALRGGQAEGKIYWIPLLKK